MWHWAGRREIAILFQLAPRSIAIDDYDRAVRTDFPEGWNVVIKPWSEQLPELESEHGQISYIHTQKEDRPAFRYELSKDAVVDVRFFTLVAPYAT